MPSLRKRHSAPRDMSDGGAVIPQPVVDAALNDAQATVDHAFAPDVAAVEAEQQQQPPQPQPHALRTQVDALRQAEEIHRAEMLQRQQQAPLQRATETERQPEVQFTPAEIELNAAHPDLLSNSAMAQIASMAVGTLAQRNIQRGSPEYESALGPMVEQMIASAKAMAAPPATPSAPLATEPAMERRIPVSAPVSRDVPSGNFDGLPSKVTLSPAEREHARLAGISELVYAQNKLRLMQLKKSGFYSESDG